MKYNISIGEIVATDFRAASVFKEAGIDFCCGGKKSIGEACNEKGINQAEVEKKLADLESAPADGCNTYNVTFRLLEQFEDDLHVHVHLENNILFPKALKTIY